jgi:glycerol-3-phosphate dehydrogenase
MLRPDEVGQYARDLRRHGLRGAGLFADAQVDDARLVIETLRGARALGGAAVNHAELIGFEHGADGRLVAARVRDLLGAHSRVIRAAAFVNAAGPGVERVRGLDRPVRHPELRPAKGVHVVIPRERVHLEAAVAFPAADGRQLFAIPWGDVTLLGTTDDFTDEIEEPGVTIEEVHYVLEAANLAFPSACLTTNDLRSVFAGVRPLAADADEETPPSSVSREHRIGVDPSGLLSAAGGKLTTHRSMAERIVDRVVRALPAERRRTLGPTRTRELPLRVDDFDRARLEAELRDRHALPAPSAAHLVRAYGADAERVLEEADPELRRPVGGSRYTLAEIGWCLRTECAATLRDLLERRMRMAIFAVGQGLPELAQIARVAGQAAGWDEERVRHEMGAYAAAIRRNYQIVAPGRERAQPSPVARRSQRSAA